MRSANAKAASLGAVPTSSVIGVGAPSYTSGTHMWYGTAPSLNAIPETTNTRPNNCSRWLSPLAVSVACATRSRSSEPVAPYSIDMPYSSMPEASAPSTKYFIAASAGPGRSRCEATSAYSASDCSSRPRYSVMKLPAAIMISMPSSENSTSTKFSPVNSPRTVK